MKSPTMKYLMGAFAALCLLFATPIFAYEENTHFIMSESSYLTCADNLAISTGRWYIDGLP